MTRSGKGIIAAAALVFLVGACGSSKSSTSLNPGASNNSSNNSSSGSGNGSFGDLLKKSKPADIKITYKGDKENNTFTLIQRGDDTVFITGDTSVYSVGGKTTSCQGTGSTATCTELPQSSGLGKGLGTGL